MIDVKEAVRIAFEYVADLMADEKIGKIRLEEVERTQNDAEWIVTVSFPREPVPLNSGVAAIAAAATLTPDRAERAYREVRIDAASGQVISMKRAKAA